MSLGKPQLTQRTFSFLFLCLISLLAAQQVWAKKEVAIEILTDGVSCSHILTRVGDTALYPFRYNRIMPDLSMSARVAANGFSWLYQMNTSKQVYRQGEQLAEIDLDLWHGFGAEYSHAGAMIHPTRVYSDRRDGLFQYVRNAAKQYGEKFPLVWATAVDLPFSGNGPRSHENLSFQEEMARLAQYLRWRKSIHPGRPLVVNARSASTSLLVQVNALYPGIIDAMILMAPLHYLDVAGWSKSNEILSQMIASGKIQPNQAGIDWIKKIYPQMTWASEANWNRGVPTLVIIGEKDEETPRETRDWFLAYAGLEKREVVVLANAPHDALRVDPQRRSQGFDGTATYLEISRFLRKHRLIR